MGGNAQIKSMKKVAGTLKLDQALYREMEAFSKFGGDLDAATKSVIDKGARNVEISETTTVCTVCGRKTGSYHLPRYKWFDKRCSR